LPFLGMLIGPVFLNRVQPLVLGMPLLLAWLVMWVPLTSATRQGAWRLRRELQFARFPAKSAIRPSL